jgi:MFS family permease
MNISKPETPPQSNSLFTFSLIMFLVFTGMRMMTGQMVGAFIPVYLVDEKGFSQTLSSLVYGNGFLMGLVAAPVGGLFASRFGEKKWLLIVLSLSYVFLGLAVAVPNTFVFVAFYLSYDFCSFLGMAANSAVMAYLSPSRRRGVAYAFFFLPGSIMGAVAPLIAASIAYSFGLTSVFVIASAVYAFGLATFKLGVKT